VVAGGVPVALSYGVALAEWGNLQSGWLACWRVCTQLVCMHRAAGEIPGRWLELRYRVCSAARGNLENSVPARRCPEPPEQPGRLAYARVRKKKKEFTKKNSQKSPETN
jgi:hypothetical protein